jgi:hypothetical protein
VGNSRVTAVGQLPVGNQIFLGFENGEVISFHPASGGIHVLARESGPILSLVVDASKTYLVILSQMAPDKVCLRVISRELGFRMIDYYWLTVIEPARLAACALSCMTDFAVLCHGNSYRLFALPNLVGASSIPYGPSEEVPEIVIHGRLDAKNLWMLAIYDRRAELLTGHPPRRTVQSYTYTPLWVPGVNQESTLAQVPLHAVLLDTGNLELAGIDSNGSLQRSMLSFKNISIKTTSFHPVGAERYRAFACVRSELMAGVHAHGVDWWTPSRVRPVQTKVPLNNPIAAFPLPETRELLIIGAEGWLTRVPVAE